MEIKVNNYVRTKSGCICKIININDYREPSMKYGVEASYLKDIMFIGDEDIVKTAEGTPRGLLNLIEVGDYVNGYKVLFIDNDLKGTKNIKCIDNAEERQSFYDNDIKSVLTKEMFEQMEYKIEKE